MRSVLFILGMSNRDMSSFTIGFKSPLFVLGFCDDPTPPGEEEEDFRKMTTSNENRVNEVRG